MESKKQNKKEKRTIYEMADGVSKFLHKNKGPLLSVATLVATCAIKGKIKVVSIK